MYWIMGAELIRFFDVCTVLKLFNLFTIYLQLFINLCWSIAYISISQRDLLTTT